MTTLSKVDVTGGTVTKGNGTTADGNGYNPYRSHGQFASGPRKARPKSDRKSGVVDAKSVGGKKVPAQSGAYHPAAAKPKPIKEAKAAVDVAKKNPSPENIKAARDSVSKARGGMDRSKIGVDKTSGDKSSRKQAAAIPQKSAHEVGVERLKHAEGSEPIGYSGHLIDAIGNGGIRDSNGRLIDLSDKAQSAVRDHYNNIARNSGMIQHPVPRSDNVAIKARAESELGGADASHNLGSGLISISDRQLANLGYHAQDHAYDPASTARNFSGNHADPGVVASHVMMHETVHGFGPQLHWDPSVDTHHWQLAEEMSTEMSARHLTATQYGLEAHKIYGEYHDVMHDAVGHVSAITGASHEKAFDALAKASVEQKRRTGTMHPKDALHHMASDSLRHLGLNDPNITKELGSRWSSLAEDMKRRYPWP